VEESEKTLGERSGTIPFIAFTYPLPRGDVKLSETRRKKGTRFSLLLAFVEFLGRGAQNPIDEQPLRAAPSILRT
jgi:hypothetical protein